MFPYFDLSLTLVICVALIILVLVLVSFVLNARRASALEDRLDLLEKNLAKSTEEKEQLLRNAEESEKKRQILERTCAYLSDQAQQCVDRFAGIEAKSNDFSTKFEEINGILQKITKELDDFKTSKASIDASGADAESEHSALNNAKKLLKQGFDENEVSLQTGLPAGEVDMISRMLAPYPEHEKTADTALSQSSAVLSREPVRHKTASLRARSAYGMNSSLRRQR